MRGWRELLTLMRWPGAAPTEEEGRAMSYLERRGQKFLVHFGIANAVEKARQDWKERRDEVKRSFR
jgi:hypothetical protein